MSQIPISIQLEEALFV